MTNWRLGVAVLLFITGVSGCDGEKYGYVPLGASSDVTSMVVLNDENMNSRNNYASVAPLGDNKFIISNYMDLFLLDRKSGKLCKVSTENSVGETMQAKITADGQRFQDDITYNPTGVYASVDGNIFIANYKANNILVGKLDVARCTFVIEGEYNSTDTLGPENVVVDEASRLLISANYDSGTVVAFDLESKQEKWSTSIPQAHGVTVSEGKVYATGLTERKIYEINIETGAVIRSKGSLGWDPMAAQYLWPASIHPLKNGNLVVADPQSGFVSILDAISLDVIRYTGGNGPAENLFNYPYAAIPVGDELMVLSSMRGDIVFFDPDDMNVLEKFSFTNGRWPEKSADETKVSPVFGVTWKGYIDMSELGVKLAEADYRLGFGNLHPVSTGPIFKIPDSGGLFNPSAYMYFLQGYAGPDVDIVFSSSSQTLLGVVHKEGYPDVLIPRSIDIDSWKVGDALVSGRGEHVPLKQVSSELRRVAQVYYKKLEAQGWIDKSTLYSVIGFSDRGLNFEQFLTRFDKAFESAEGREFKFAYDQCSERECNRSSLEKAALAYFINTSTSSYISLEEYSLVGMVSGVSPLRPNQVRVDFDGCEGASYYQGYGVEALKTEVLSDYLSAVDIARSSLCMTIKNNDLVQGIDFVWNDVETAPKALEIYGKNSEDTSWHLVGKYPEIKVSVVGGFATTNLLFGKEISFSHFYIKIIDGGVQNRLILRQVMPVFGIKKSPDNSSFAFVNCPTGGSYPGYGTEAFETDSLDDYFSALSTSESSVCFSNTSGRLLEGLGLGWYSADEVGELVQVFGSAHSDFSREVPIGKYSVGVPYDISDYYFSDIKVNSKIKYPFYRLQLLKGEGQGRLILRSFTPVYSIEEPGGNVEIRLIARSVSAGLHYGPGISKAAEGVKQSLADLDRLISSAESAHCGNYAAVFVNRLPKNTVWKIYDLSTYNGRVHSVVEVDFNHKKYVYDPVLGVEYRCSLENMINGNCEYSLDPGYHQVNPALRIFRGLGFFYGAKIVRTYSSSRDLISPYF